MIYFNIALTLPIKIFSKELYYLDKPISKNKAFSIQIDYDRHMLFCLGFSWILKQSHSGPLFEIGLLGLNIILNLYDQRHWFDKENRWEKYPDESMTDEEWAKYYSGKTRPV